MRPKYRDDLAGPFFDAAERYRNGQVDEDFMCELYPSLVMSRDAITKLANAATEALRVLNLENETGYADPDEWEECVDSLRIAILEAREWTRHE